MLRNEKYMNHLSLLEARCREAKYIAPKAKSLEAH